MEESIIEKTYPISFHTSQAKLLGEHFKKRDNVVLIGMKRVGISNFLRFFLYHPQIVDTYINDGYKHMFVPVDLNDLVEREIGPFWILTLKRIADTVEHSITATPELKKQVAAIFLESIQTQDTFLTIDSIRKCCGLLAAHGYMPTIFFVLFDRITDVATPEFFANLEGLRDATNAKLSYVFTSYRSLDSLSPQVFSKANLLVFSRDMYMKPASKTDISTIFQTDKKRYDLKLSEQQEEDLMVLVDGYVRYMQLALIILHEKKESLPKDKNELFTLLSKDERVYLQSEELWESLTIDEKNILQKVVQGKDVAEGERALGKYLWETGIVSEAEGKQQVFSALFEEYVLQKDKKVVSDQPGVEFTKKEHLLFDFLKNHLDEVSEREAIIEAVWPEVEELGVSDWAIDRLVARVRNKLRLQKSNFEIQTIKTRGYKLITIRE